MLYIGAFFLALKTSTTRIRHRYRFLINRCTLLEEALTKARLSILIKSCRFHRCLFYVKYGTKEGEKILTELNFTPIVRFTMILNLNEIRKILLTSFFAVY